MIIDTRCARNRLGARAWHSRKGGRTVRVRNCADLILNSKLEGILPPSLPPARVRLTVRFSARPPALSLRLCNVGPFTRPRPCLRSSKIQDHHQRPQPLSSRALPHKVAPLICRTKSEICFFLTLQFLIYKMDQSTNFAQLPNAKKAIFV